MKKLLVMALTLISILLLISPGYAMEKDYDFYKNIKLVVGEKQAEVNGQPASMDQAAYIKNGRTLVPFRFLGESLGAEILWDASKNQATLKTGDTEVIITIGSKVAYVNGKISTLDVPAEVSAGRAFIPLRFVSESLGALVDYDGQTQTITVRYVNTSNWSEYTDPSTGVHYRYPSDWKITSENDSLIVTSPTGTTMSIILVSDTVDNAQKFFKDMASKNGWTLESEYPNDPQDIEKGIELQFDIYDSETDTYIWHDVFCNSFDGNTLIGDVQLKDENFEEGLIMNQILLS